MFTQQQTAALSADLNRKNIKHRSQAGMQLSYIESHHAIREANRIFGFEGWSSETVDIVCIRDAVPDVAYRAKVRITVYAGDRTIVREGIGFGNSRLKNVCEAHENAGKTAESDAQKRALRHFGDQFGLTLYDKDQANVTDENEAPAPVAPRAPIHNGNASPSRTSASEYKQVTTGYVRPQPAVTMTPDEPADEPERVPDDVPRTEAVAPTQDPKVTGIERRKAHSKQLQSADSKEIKANLLYHLDRMKPGARDFQAKWDVYEQTAKLARGKLTADDAAMITRFEARLQSKQRQSTEKQRATA